MTKVKLYFLILDNKGELSMFWLAHKNEQNQCKIDGDYDANESVDNKTSRADLQPEKDKYKHYKYTSGVVVKLVNNIFMKSNQKLYICK